MSHDLKPLTPPEEVGPRKVVSVVSKGDGWEVTLECGHESWWEYDPPTYTAHCSQCLDAYLERLRAQK